MSMDNRKRTAETQLINKHEAKQIHKEEEEEGCGIMGNCSNPELPTHIVVDILSRLPMKTLFNFLSVCKDWLSLISDPHFAKLHLSKSQVTFLLKPTHPQRRSWDFTLVDLHITPSTRPCNARMKLLSKINLPKERNFPCNVINSCNGLLCLYGLPSDGSIYLYNPLLGELVTLPKCPSGSVPGDSCAFGFSPVANQYKVVQSFRSRVLKNMTGRETCKAEIYTLGEGSWRSLGKIPTGICNSSFNAFVNGSLHWLHSERNLSGLIYCFDFGSEQFQAVPEPSEFGPFQKEFRECIRVGVLRGCLSLCEFNANGNIEIWVMKDYGVKESWSKEFVIGCAMQCGGCFCNYEPIMVLENGQLLLFEYCRHAICVYDSVSKSLRNVHAFGENRYVRGIAHVPSLLSLMDVAKGEILKAGARTIVTRTKGRTIGPKSRSGGISEGQSSIGRGSGGPLTTQPSIGGGNGNPNQGQTSIGWGSGGPSQRQSPIGRGSGPSPSQLMPTRVRDVMFTTKMPTAQPPLRMKQLVRGGALGTQRFTHRNEGTSSTLGTPGSSS